MTTTPTSGAAIQRYKIGYHSDEWGQRSRTPSGIPDASGSWVRYADHVTALAAGQATAAQPAAQQGAAYAEMPEPYCNAHDDADACYPDMFSEHQMRAFADATYALRASHGQAPSQAGEYPALVCDYCGALTPDPWHSSGMLHGKMSKHIHSCDACAARGAAKAQAADSVTAPAPPPECETEAEKRAFAFGWFKALESERMKADNKKKDPL